MGDVRKFHATEGQFLYDTTRLQSIMQANYHHDIVAKLFTKVRVAYVNSEREFKIEWIYFI